MSLLKSTDKLVEGLNNKFFTEERAQQALQTEIDGLQSGINNEQSARQAADSGFDGRLNVIEGSGVGSINKAKQDAKDYADQKVADLINGAPAMLDTLKEIADQLGNDESAVSALTSTVAANLQTAKDYADGKVSQEVSDRQAAVSSEASARQSADSALSTRVGVLEQDPTTKTYVDGQISSEQTARQNAVSAEQTRAQGAESALSGRIGSLELDSVTKTYVDGQVSSEQTARQNADTALGGRLDILEGSGAGSVLKAKQDAQSYADQKISDLINGAPGTLDTLKEIADQLASDESAVGALTSTVASNLQTAKDYADGKVDAEKSRAQGVEAGISSNLSSEVSRAQAEEQTLVKLDGSRSMTGNLNLGDNSVVGSSQQSGNLILSSTSSGMPGVYQSKGFVGIEDGSPLILNGDPSNLFPAKNNAVFQNALQGYPLSLAASGQNNWDLMALHSDGNGTCAGIDFKTYGGTFASPEFLNKDNPLGQLNFFCYKGEVLGNEKINAMFQAIVTENHNADAFGSGFKFSATKQGAKTIDAALTVRPEYLQMHGGMVAAQKSVNENYSLVLGDHIVCVSDLSVSRTITLPTASSVPAGMIFMIKDQTGQASGSKYVRVACQGSETVDGAAYYDLTAAYESVTVMSNGTNWFLF